MAGYREEKGELRLDGLDGGCGERRDGVGGSAGDTGD